jgi:HK97 family phage prohead protease
MTEPMMLQMLAAEVEASEEARTITGKITVFSTLAESHGLTIAPGALQPRTPLSRVKLLRDHNMSDPVGYMTEFRQEDDAAYATFYVPAGENGDRALHEAGPEQRLRDGLSVGFMPLKDGFEFDDDFNLTVTAAELYEVSLCAIPAFQDAQVESVAAAVAFARKQKELKMTETPTAPPAVPAATPPAAPAALAVPAAPAMQTGPASLAVPAAPVNERRALMTRITEGRNVQLALDPIIQADVFDPTTVPAFIGEIWRGKEYAQRYASLVAHDTLTGHDMTGWRWVTTPDVDDYAGNLAEVPTNVVTCEAVTFNAARTASGHKVDRIHVDMPNPVFWNSFYSERAANYARLMDGKVLTHLSTLANHTAVVDATTDPWEKLIVGAQNVLEFAAPDWAIVGADLYRTLALTTELDKLAFLNASLGLEEGTLANFRIVGAPPSATALNGKVIVGATAATTLYELPGGPVRVEALDIANGGVDAGLFGYHALFTNDKRGIVSVNVA